MIVAVSILSTVFTTGNVRIEVNKNYIENQGRRAKRKK